MATKGDRGGAWENTVIILTGPRTRGKACHAGPHGRTWSRSERQEQGRARLEPLLGLPREGQSGAGEMVQD